MWPVSFAWATLLCIKTIPSYNIYRSWLKRSGFKICSRYFHISEDEENLKMSSNNLLSPYLNRFVTLINQNATAKLELSCIAGKVKVNITHELEQDMNRIHLNQLILILNTQTLWRRMSGYHNSIDFRREQMIGLKKHKIKQNITKRLQRMHW